MSDSEIKTEAEAEAKIKEVCAFLSKSNHKATKCRYDPEELESADFARLLCWEILDSAKADGLGGCKLCKS